MECGGSGYCCCACRCVCWSRVPYHDESGWWVVGGKRWVRTKKRNSKTIDTCESFFLSVCCVLFSFFFLFFAGLLFGLLVASLSFRLDRSELNLRGIDQHEKQLDATKY